MKRPVESSQRKMRMLALRIEGSTGTPSLEGPDKMQATIADTNVGVYTITFNKAFVQAPIVICTCEGDDSVASAVSTTTGCVITVKDLDETAAAEDDDVNVLIIGSDASGFY